MYKNDFVTSQVVRKPIMVQCVSIFLMWTADIRTLVNGLFGEIGHKYIGTFKSSGFLNEGEGKD